MDPGWLLFIDETESIKKKYEPGTGSVDDQQRDVNQPHREPGTSAAPPPAYQEDAGLQDIHNLNIVRFISDMPGNQSNGTPPYAMGDWNPPSTEVCIAYESEQNNY